jgi:hypothetical protein
VSHWISHGSSIVVEWVGSCKRFKPHAQSREPKRSRNSQGIRISDFGISEVLLTKVKTLHGESLEIAKISQPSI